MVFCFFFHTYIYSIYCHCAQLWVLQIGSLNINTLYKKSVSLNVTFHPYHVQNPTPLLLQMHSTCILLCTYVVFICTLFSCSYERDVHIIVVLYVDLVHMFYYSVIITSFDFLLPQLTRNSSFEIYYNPGITWLMCLDVCS